MCGIFGIIAPSPVSRKDLRILAKSAYARGRDSSGLVIHRGAGYDISRSDTDILSLLSQSKWSSACFVAGHSRLVTNGSWDNQPVVSGNLFALHNGIIVNDSEIWPKLGRQRQLEIDTEVLLAIAADHIQNGNSIESLPDRIFSQCQGAVSAALGIPALGKLCLMSNTGSLYIGTKHGATYFSSEEYALAALHCRDIKQLRRAGVVLDIPLGKSVAVSDRQARSDQLVIPLVPSQAEERLLVYREHSLRRCTRCILPSSMPYITFDDQGVCNYCHNYRPRNAPKPVEQILRLVEPYRRANEAECIIPFSGGRDSCWSLHLVCKELGLKPITYTYDWGMVTDLARRNISRMSAQLGVENIIVAADVVKKRRYIAMNLKAWLKKPSLGMVSILTAGDKHFFRHIETVKRRTGIALNLWGINPLEVTHFKSGFLGIKPDFLEKRVYAHGPLKQLDYQRRRFGQIVANPGYLNRSLGDTLSGEYFRSLTRKSDYHHVFDYWRWDERVCESVLQEYDWELAPDTPCTWRIGDGTAAFYNYVYYTLAGFTEHDTFRSNQIREGQLSREDALELVRAENRPRYQNIRWYLDVLGFDFGAVVTAVNQARPVPDLLASL